MTRRRAGFTLIELAVVISIIAVLISLLLPAVQASREGARRAQCGNNLMQLGMSVANYESTFRVFPPGSVGRAGPVVESPASPEFGWIAQVLPFLEQKAAFHQLNFAVGAYQPENQTVRLHSMNVLLCPSMMYRGSTSFGAITPSDAQTNYAACHHPTEAPIDVDNKGMFFLNSHVRVDQLEDGASHTIFLGEKPTQVEYLGWTSGTSATLRNTGTPLNQTRKEANDLFAPITPPSDAADGQPPVSPPATPRHVGGFGSSHPSGANFVFGDGSLHFIRNTIGARVYHLLADRADGEAIGDDEF